MSHKNKIYTFISVIVFSLLVAIFAEAGKKKRLTKKNIPEISGERKVYLSQPLQPYPVPTVTSGFNLHDSEESYFYDGWIGMKGFPLIHPQNIADITNPRWIHLLAELNPIYTVLPKGVANLDGQLTHIKVVIMSTPWQTPTLYHPQYAIDSYNELEQQDDQEFYDPQNYLQNTKQAQLLVTITGSSSGHIHLESNKIKTKYVPLTFNTEYSNIAEKLVAVSQNAPIVVSKHKTNQEATNISEISNSSFWIIHQEAQKKTATFFWILNDENLRLNLNSLLLQPEQTWLGLMKAFKDTKWGEPAKRLRKMFGLEQSSVDIVEDEPDSKQTSFLNQYFMELLPLNMQDLKKAAKKWDETVFLDPAVSPLDSALSPVHELMSKQNAQNWFERMMEQCSIVHYPVTGSRSIYHTMTNLVNYHQLLVSYKPENNPLIMDKTPPLIHNSYDVVQKLLNALQKLQQNINSNGESLLVAEMNSLFTTDSRPENLEKTIVNMIASCEHFLKTPEDSVLSSNCLISSERMFGLLGLLYHIEISYYVPSFAYHLSPRQIYTMPDNEYPLITNLLKDDIEPLQSVENELPYIISSYFSEENNHHNYSTWLLFEQIITMQSALKSLFKHRAALNLFGGVVVPEWYEMLNKSGVLNINTLQHWCQQAYKQQENRAVFLK